MTLKQIALLAHVSVSTASRALNNSYDISDDTRKHVLAVAEKYGYFEQKKKVKLNNRKRKNYKIAIISPEIISINYSKRIKTLANLFSLKGHSTVVYSTDFDIELTGEIARECVNNNDIDAIISICGETELQLTNKNINIPIVVTFDSDRFSCFSVDMHSAIRSVVEYYHNKGFTEMGFAGERYTLDKALAYRECVDEFGDKIGGIFTSSKRFEDAGVEAAEYFLKQEKIPQVILCGYDEIAIGLISTLTENGIRVPQDVSVVGLNDIPSAKYCFGGLSTVNFDFEAIADAVVNDILSDKMGVIHKRKYEIPYKLIIRNT